MNPILILKKLGCRIFQISFPAALPILSYREPKIVSSCSTLGEVLKTVSTALTPSHVINPSLTKRLGFILLCVISLIYSKLYEKLLHIF